MWNDLAPNFFVYCIYCMSLLQEEKNSFDFAVFQTKKSCVYCVVSKKI